MVAASSTLVAQSTTTASTSTTTPVAATSTVTGATINERKVDQEDRIANGLKDGDLTAGKAATLETQEAGINKEEAGMRAQDDGHLTAQDKTTLNGQLNVESKDIYADKHSGATDPKRNSEINDRLDNQQDRIANGIDKDKLTDTQVAKLETQEAGIDKEDAGMKAQDNGKLTAANKKLLNKQLNQESARIARDERRTLKKK
jgi:hypothetical protein